MTTSSDYRALAEQTNACWQDLRAYLVKRRADMRVSIRDVAVVTGYSRTTIGRIENDAPGIALEQKLRWAHVVERLAPGTSIVPPRIYHDNAARRRALGLSQADVADIAGYSDSTIGAWESSERVPSKTQLSHWNEALARLEQRAA